MPNNEQKITLGVLNAIHDNSRITQRSMAGELGIALGLTNSYLKRCVKKGLIKVKHAPANRYAYYLTPQGFSEKSRLAREYLTQGFQFFRIAREQCSEIFRICSDQGQKKIALHGLTDLTEIAVLCASEHDVELVSIIDPSSKLDKYNDIPIHSGFSSLDDFDALIITDLGSSQQEFDLLVKHYGTDCVFAPAILKLSSKSKLKRMVGYHG
jgi:DNA-binding MarR family transcriptional regulator|tara:strand:+ start:92 stop:724 length:633 start_codon:yes stop_codon:yes gene_type:complete